MHSMSSIHIGRLLSATVRKSMYPRDGRTNEDGGEARSFLLGGAMPSDLVIRMRSEGATLEIPAALVSVGARARPAAETYMHALKTAGASARLLLTGDRDYFATTVKYSF